MITTYNVKCEKCSIDFKVPKYRLKTAKYCSRLCKDSSTAILIKTNCNICKKEFEHISARCNKAKYCSRKCYYISQKNKGKKEYTCLHCKKKFIGHAAHNRKFCSKSCTSKCEKSIWNPKFTTVRKKMIKENMIEHCQKCGYNSVKEILGVHHIDGNRDNNTKENLMVLCPMCHSLIHRKHIPH